MDYILCLVAVLLFSKSVFGRGLEHPQQRGSIRKKRVHLYRSRRHLLLNAITKRSAQPRQDCGSWGAPLFFTAATMLDMSPSPE